MTASPPESPDAPPAAPDAASPAEPVWQLASARRRKARTCLHATAVMVEDRGVLITGPSGAGKSTLALRLLDETGRGLGPAPLKARLVADDRVIVRRDDLSLTATAPEALAGLLEVRGLGIVRLPEVAASMPVHLVVRLHPRLAALERMPAMAYTSILGIARPLLSLSLEDAAAPARLRAALTHAGLVT